MGLEDKFKLLTGSKVDSFFYFKFIHLNST